MAARRTLLKGDETPEERIEKLYKNVKALSQSYKSINETKFVRSGSVAFDAILGGGIPEGAFILLSAENGCGKSTLALFTSHLFMLQGKKVLYLDFEGGVSMSLLDGIGLTEHLYHSTSNPQGTFFLFQPRTYRDAEKILDVVMEDVDLVVIDSITAILTSKLAESSSEDTLPGLDARVCSLFLKRYRAAAVKSGTSWIIINQIRTRIAFGYGETTVDQEAGGNALKFLVDVRLWMTRKHKGELMRSEDTATAGKQEVQFGALCTLKALKNRFERPNIPLSIAIIFGRGVSNNYSYLDFLLTDGCVTKKNKSTTTSKPTTVYTVLFDPDNPVVVEGTPEMIEWIERNRQLVKDKIEEKGGFRLLLNKAGTLDISDVDIYNESVIDDFRNISLKGDEDVSDASENS